MSEGIPVRLRRRAPIKRLFYLYRGFRRMGYSRPFSTNLALRLWL